MKYIKRDIKASVKIKMTYLLNSFVGSTANPLSPYGKLEDIQEEDAIQKMVHC